VVQDGSFHEAEQHFTSIMEHLQSPKNFRKTLDLIEGELGIDGRELLRRLLQGHVDARGQGDIGEHLHAAGGTTLTHRRVIETALHTMFGKIRIRRVGYSQRGHANVFPLDAAMNLPGASFSHGLQRFLARHIANVSFEEALNLVAEVSGVVIGKRQGVALVQNCAADFDKFYGKQDKVDSGKEPILVLTTDGKGIVMRPEGLRDETRERAKKATKKMRTRLARGEKANRKRMAQVASIYAIARFPRTPKEVIDEFARRNATQRRPRPQRKRAWASVEKEARVVMGALFDEAKRRDPKREKEWVILVDGQNYQLDTVESLCKKNGVQGTVILDIIHVIEYLWIAARLFHEEIGAKCERWVEAKLDEILHSRATKVAGSIRMSAARAPLSPDKKKIAEDCARYIANRAPYMHYEHYLKKGYPIATGVIEGACRYLIKDRMDFTGARWSLTGAEAVLKLRSLVKSGDFDEYWQFHLQHEFERNHVSKLANIDQISALLPS
jgi:hypothetical protein